MILSLLKVALSVSLIQKASLLQEGAGLGYSIAYMRALVQSVTKAPYQPINAQYEGGSAKL